MAVAKSRAPFAIKYEGGWVGYTGTAAQTNLELVAAPGAGRSIFIDYIHFTNLSAANTMELRDGSGGTALWRSYAPAGVMTEDTGWLQVGIGLTANTALCLNTTAAAGHAVKVYYHIEDHA